MASRILPDVAPYVKNEGNRQLLEWLSSIKDKLQDGKSRTTLMQTLLQIF